MAQDGEVVKVQDLGNGGTSVQIIPDPPKPPRRFPGVPCPPTEAFNVGDKVTFELTDPSGGNGGPEIAYDIKLRT